MSIGLTGFCIPDIGVNKVEQSFFLILLQVFQIFKALQGLFVKALVNNQGGWN
ncbi:MAG: hypothetical protein J0H74_17780 [Chitinophagaceae bacterium]|nr:hypothetical protein [Chitinophagaceae bacterium]